MEKNLPDKPITSKEMLPVMESKLALNDKTWVKGFENKIRKACGYSRRQWYYQGKTVFIDTLFILQQQKRLRREGRHYVDYTAR